MTRPAWLLFVAVSALSGSAYLVIKLAVEDLPAPLVAFGRVALGAALLMPVALARGELRPLRGRGRDLVVLAGLEFAAPFYLVTAGSARIPSSLVGVLMAAGPLLTVLFARRMDPSERAGGRRLLGLGLGAAGVVVLLGLEVGGGGRALAGAGLVLAGCASFAAGGLWLRRAFADTPVVGLVAACLTVSAGLLGVPAALVAPTASPTAGGLVALGCLGLFYAAVNFTLFAALVARAGAGRAAVTAYVAPAIAVLLGVAVLGEPAGAGLLAGLALVLAGSWLATRREAVPSPAAPLA